MTTKPRRGPFLRSGPAEEYIGLSGSGRTLERWRHLGVGPPFIRVSARAVRYSQEDLDLFMAERRRTSTSDQGTAAS